MRRRLRGLACFTKVSVVAKAAAAKMPRALLTGGAVIIAAFLGAHLLV